MTEVIGPILLQRQCDGGRGDLSPEELAQAIAKRLQGTGGVFLGCGTIFQYWWGNCYCPGCGRMYDCTIEHLKRYRLPQISVSSEWKSPSPKKQAKNRNEAY